MQNSFQVDLIKAIEAGSLEKIRRLVIGKYDIDKPLIPLHDVQVNPESTRVPFPSIRGPTPLVLAILYEKIDIIEYFIKEKNASLITAVGDLYPIHYACIIGNVDIIDLIVSADSTNKLVNKQNSFKYTPLHLASSNGHIKALLYLLKKGAEANPKDLPDSGNTPLHVCMRSNDTTIAEALISKGADINATNGFGETPKDTARHFNNDTMCNFLEQVERKSASIRSFEVLCQSFLDGDSNTKADTVEELTAELRELKSRLEKLEK